jgi:hypothetical protein
VKKILQKSLVSVRRKEAGGWRVEVDRAWALARWGGQGLDLMMRNFV